MADPTQLVFAILNLAVNARDFMPDSGDLSVPARAKAIAGDLELPAGDYIEIEVSDTGSGMSQAVAARAFDPFFTTKGVGKGNASD
jgi:signal transduction histidine kinase